MSGIWLIVTFVLAIILMIVAISKWKVHPFIALMGISLILAIVDGIPLDKIPGIIGSGFSGIFTSIGIVIILGALIGTILEKTGGALKLAEMVARLVGKKHRNSPWKSWDGLFPFRCSAIADSSFLIRFAVRCRKRQNTVPSP